MCARLVTLLYKPPQWNQDFKYHMEGMLMGKPCITDRAVH